MLIRSPSLLNKCNKVRMEQKKEGNPNKLKKGRTALEERIEVLTETFKKTGGGKQGEKMTSGGVAPRANDLIVNSFRNLSSSQCDEERICLSLSQGKFELTLDLSTNDEKGF